MILRVQGINKEEARYLGQEVTQHLSENLPETFQNSRLEFLNVNVSIPSGTSHSEMSGLITSAIIKGLL